MKLMVKALAVGLVMFGVLQGCATKQASEEAVRTLAPRGELRAAMYRGSPTSFVQAQPGDEPRGVNYELAQAFAKSLGVPFKAMIFTTNAEALKAVAAGDADFTFTNATPAARRMMDFSPVVFDVEKSVLVAQSSPVRTLDDIKRPGLRIGASAGSSTSREMKSIYPQAVMVSAPSLAKAIDMLRSGEIDAFATNKAILFEMSDKLPGARVVPGNWDVEHFAIGIPKGREAGSATLADFVRDARAKGVIDAAVKRANLRGVIAPQ